jgi:hypothetical protein
MPLLKGDDLEINGAKYSIKDKNGNDFYLGKLKSRGAAYSHYQEKTSSFNNSFIFENMPRSGLLTIGPSEYHNTEAFFETGTSGGKKKRKNRKSRKSRKSRKV